jgi:hypothetical protein
VAVKQHFKKVDLAQWSLGNGPSNRKDLQPVPWVAARIVTLGKCGKVGVKSEKANLDESSSSLDTSIGVVEAP